MIDQRRVVLQALLRWVCDKVEGDQACPSLDEVRESLIHFGSETDDNLRALGALKALKSDRGCGLTVDGVGISLADLINRMEGIAVPAEISDSVPGLTQERWEASLRIITLLLVALER